MSSMGNRQPWWGRDGERGSEGLGVPEVRLGLTRIKSEGGARLLAQLFKDGCQGAKAGKGGLQEVKSDKSGQQEPELIPGEVGKDNGYQDEGAGNGQHDAVNGHGKAL